MCIIINVKVTKITLNFTIGGIKLIYTVTFNPSIDYIIRLDKFTAGAINRVNYEQVLGGGKGVNVSIVLGNFGQPTTALGFVAGFTGAELCRQLDGFGAKHAFVMLPKGFSRINVKAKADVETEINGQGPDIPEQYRDELFKQVERELKTGDTIVVAGSIPKTLPSDMYEQLLAHVPAGVKIVVDAEKDLLLKCLKFKPFLIKPNNHELGAMFGVSIPGTDTEKIAKYAKRLQEQGAQNVLVSLAGDGAFLLDADGQQHSAKPPRGQLVNSVGAGDSMVAGFLTGYIESNGDYEKAFRMGIATGSASAFSENLATRPEVDALLKTME